MEEKYWNPWSSPRQSMSPRSPVCLPSTFSGRNYNFIIHELKEDNPYMYLSYNWNGSLGTAKLEGNYGNTYSSTTHLKPLFRFPTPDVPKSNYIQKEKQPIGYPSSEEPEIHYRIGHVQLKPNY
ncbi:uncharacterized protein LOC144242504 [Crocuta crocuta]